MIIDNINTMKNIDEFKFISYLIGAMEKTAEGDSGESKREKLFNGLAKRNVFPIDPTRTEVMRTGFTSKELKSKMEGWTASGNKELRKKYSKYIWEGRNIVTEDYNIIYIPGDFHAVKISHWITAVINEGDSPCVDKNTLVLMTDFSYKKIKDLKKGNVIIGFKKIKNKTILIKSTVLNVYNKGYKDTIKIIDKHNNKLFLTPDHEILTKNKKVGSIYEKAMLVDNTFSLRVLPQTKSFYRGWASGYFRHDGCVVENWKRHEITALSDKKSELIQVKTILKKIGIKSTIRETFQNQSKYYTISVSEIFNFYKLYDLMRNLRPGKEFRCGFVSGSIDADGWYCDDSIRYSQSIVHGKNLVDFENSLNTLKIAHSKIRRKPRNIKIANRKLKSHSEITFCISKTNAFYITSQLEYKRKKLNLTIGSLNSKIIHKKSYRRNVYDIQTTSGNFVANGFIVHNCGTFGEAGLATDRKIPLYIITELPKYKLPGSFRQWMDINDGEVFHSEHDYFKFIDKKYKLKEKK